MARILLIEDDPDQLRIRKLTLETAGHAVAAADGADSALLAFDAGVETVIMDLRLPRAEDGLALIRRLREASPQVRIIVLSGWMPGFSGLPEAALVDAWAAKPVRSRKLLELIG